MKAGATKNAAILARIDQLLAGGYSSGAIAKQLKSEGHSCSRATVGRLMQARNGRQRCERVSRGASGLRATPPSASRIPPVGASHGRPDPDGEPDGTEHETSEEDFIVAAAATGAGAPLEADELETVLRDAPALHRELLSECWKNFRAAEGPLKAAWASKLIAAMTEARKATPPPPVDPNELPDMVAAAKRAREKLHRMVDAVAAERGR